jgi:hypothetical protein
LFKNNLFFRTQSSVRAPNLADSLSQYSKHSDDYSGGLNKNGSNLDDNKSKKGKLENQKMVKTTKKLPDLKLG